MNVDSIGCKSTTGGRRLHTLSDDSAVPIFQRAGTSFPHRICSTFGSDRTTAPTMWASNWIGRAFRQVNGLRARNAIALTWCKSIYEKKNHLQFAVETSKRRRMAPLHRRARLATTRRIAIAFGICKHRTANAFKCNFTQCNWKTMRRVNTIIWR